MLLIKNEQVEALSRAAREDFERRLCRHLEETAGVSRARLEAEVPGAIDSANGFDITSERDVARYCELLYQIQGKPSPSDLPKPALNVLLAHGVPPEVKLERLHAWSRERKAESVA
ncbi:MAG: hypothetical protein K2X35_09275 [Bryobacteraceae bacterium]|nr:hypothetical protein [Bryobacteraceae bacterium]